MSTRKPVFRYPANIFLLLPVLATGAIFVEFSLVPLYFHRELGSVASAAFIARGISGVVLVAISLRLIRAGLTASSGKQPPGAAT
jgi:hypothetical protein